MTHLLSLARVGPQPRLHSGSSDTVMNTVNAKYGFSSLQLSLEVSTTLKLKLNLHTVTMDSESAKKPGALKGLH